MKQETNLSTKRGKPAIVIEGPDGSGKTTLGEKLSKMLGLEYLHLTYIKDPEAMYEQFKAADQKIAKGDVLVDRFILSNLAYAQATKSPFVHRSAHFLSNLAHRIVAGRVFHITCLPEPKTSYMVEFERLCKERDELYTSFDLMSSVYDLFKAEEGELWRMTRLSRRVMRYDRFSDTSMEEQLKNLFYLWPEEVLNLNSRAQGEQHEG